MTLLWRHTSVTGTWFVHSTHRSADLLCSHRCPSGSVEDFSLFKEQINTTCFCVMEPTRKPIQYAAAITKEMLISQYAYNSQYSYVHKGIHL